jgi:riboflavin kinase/FMN adenylyltransferase
VDPATLPADGVYAGWATIDADDAPRPAMIYVGTAPTFGPAGRRLEVHLFDFTGDLYGRHLDVCIGPRVAADRRHPSSAALAGSIHHLAVATRAMMKGSA